MEVMVVFVEFLVGEINVVFRFVFWLLVMEG